MEVLASRLHCVNDELLTAVERQDRQLQESTHRIKTEHELLGRDIVVRLTGVRPVLGREEDVEFADAVLER